MKRNDVRIALILLTLIFIFTGCFSPEKEHYSDKRKTNIVLLHGWGTLAEEDVVMREIYEDFNRQYPQIQLTLVSMPSFESLEAKAQDMLAIGKVPNIIYTGGSGTETLYHFMTERNSALDLMPYIKEDEQFARTISQEVLSRWITEDGKLYTMTDMLRIKGYWYNKKIFSQLGIDKLPTTWDEFFAVCQKINEEASARHEKYCAVKLDAAGSAVLMQAVMKQKGRTGSNYPMGEDVIEFYDKLVWQKQAVREGTLRLADSGEITLQSEFQAGKTAMLIGEAWQAKEFPQEMDLGFSPFPGEGGELTAQISAGSGYIVSNWGDEKQQEASVTFIKYMLSPEVQTQILTRIGRIPSNPQVDIEMIAQSRTGLWEAYQASVRAKQVREIPEKAWNRHMYRKYLEHISDYLREKISTENLIRKMRVKPKRRQ